MMVLYFSGTGNSRFVAELFRQRTGAECHSIEEAVDFAGRMARHGEIAVCYPVYCSGVPRLMREFAEEYRESFRDKQVLIFCTQMMFSGDGARSFTDLFPAGWFAVRYAEHFFMPNNLCNVLPAFTYSRRTVRRETGRAAARVERICRRLERDREKHRGFGALPRKVGYMQRRYFPATEEKARDNVRVGDACTACGLCARRCPVCNLRLVGGKLIPQGNCMFCYRCVNLCPRKAITVVYHKPVTSQYKGPSV
jgi:ferredoxin